MTLTSSDLRRLATEMQEEIADIWEALLKDGLSPSERSRMEHRRRVLLHQPDWALCLAMALDSLADMDMERADREPSRLETHLEIERGLQAMAREAAE